MRAHAHFNMASNSFILVAMPEIRIRGGIEREVEDVDGIFAARGKPAGQRGGELVVHEELHTPARTT